MKDKTVPQNTPKKPADVAHPGMMGDGTEEQNLDERGNPAARIKKDEVEAAFGKHKAHSTAKCNGKIFGVEENLTRSSIAEYLSGARVEFILDPLDIGI